MSWDLAPVTFPINDCSTDAVRGPHQSGSIDEPTALADSSARYRSPGRTTIASSWK